MKKIEKRIINRKTLWILFFIILFSSISIFLLFIPYLETKVISKGGTSDIRYNLSSDNPYKVFPVEFPWRSHSQKIILNVTVTEGNISLYILDTNAIENFISGQPYIPYLEINNSTGCARNIQISPPAYGPRYILIYAENNACFTIELRVSYLNYTSSYGFFFLGIAVILFFYFVYQRYIWTIHSKVEEEKMFQIVK